MQAQIEAGEALDASSNIVAASPAISADDGLLAEAFRSAAANDKKRTYAEILGVQANAYREISVLFDLDKKYSVVLSARSLNAILNAECFSLKDLLLMTPAQLSGLRNVGPASLKEIEMGLFVIAQQPPPDVWILPTDGCFVRKQVLCPLVESMLHGEPGANEELTADERAVLTAVVKAEQLLGNDVCLELLAGGQDQYVKTVVKMLVDFNDTVIFKQNLVDGAAAAASSWDQEICSKWLAPFLKLFIMSQQQDFSPEFQRLLQSNMTVGQYAECLAAELADNFGDITTLAKELEAFQAWMGKVDLERICYQVLEEGISPATEIVLTSRAAGQSFREIALQYGRWSKERVRQIEAKGLRHIRNELRRSKYHLIGLISAYRNGAQVLDKSNLAETIGSRYADLLWYGVTKAGYPKGQYLLDDSIAHYDSTYEAIVVLSNETADNLAAVANNDILEEIISDLPDLVEATALQSTLESIARERGLKPELLVLVAKKQYQAAGRCVYKNKLTVARMCDFILKKCFQSGFKIADEHDNGLFLKYLLAFFGEKGRMTARAIDAKVASLGVLVDRGRYIHPDYVSVDSGIMEKIYTYIEASPKTAIAYAEIYAALEPFFEGTMITNRHALQGIMKLYRCPYTSHRGYISKAFDKAVIDEVDAFVKRRGVIHKSELLAQFPGWKDFNLVQVVSKCPEIIGIDQGLFMHASRLVISEDMQMSLHKYLDASLGDIPVSAKYLQNEFMMHFPEFMNANHIQTSSKLFGILQYLFAKEYHFSRPYIARENIGKISRRSILLKYLEAMECVELAELVDFCKRSAVSYISMFYLLDAVQPEFVRVDGGLLMRFECIGFTDDMYQDVAQRVSEAVNAHNGYIAARQINDFSGYPALRIPWTPFLLESIAKMFPGGINTIRMVSSSSEVPHAIFVSDEYAEDDWRSLLVNLLKAEHAVEPFVTKADVLRWLQAEGLCHIKYPLFLDAEHHVYFDDNGKLMIK